MTEFDESYIFCLTGSIRWEPFTEKHDYYINYRNRGTSIRHRIDPLRYLAGVTGFILKDAIHRLYGWRIHLHSAGDHYGRNTGPGHFWLTAE